MSRIDYSVVIPAYNEEKYLGKVVKRLRVVMKNIHEFKGEIIVVDNNSSDKTAELANSLGVKLVFEPINQISRARNRGAIEAGSDFLIFLDADTLINKALLLLALNSLKSGEVGGGGSRVIFDSNQDQFFFGTVIPWIWSWVSKTFKLAAGSFIYCNKKIFDQIGGFSEKLFAGEELFFSQKFKKECRKQGLKFLIFEDYPVVTSSRKLCWFNSVQIFIYILIPIFFPIALRIKSLCAFWYRRPNP